MLTTQTPEITAGYRSPRPVAGVRTPKSPVAGWRIPRSPIAGFRSPTPIAGWRYGSPVARHRGHCS